MKNTKIIPLWSKRAQKKLIDKGMTKKELANKLGVNYTQMCNVLTGYVYNETITNKICEFLGVTR